MNKHIPDKLILLALCLLIWTLPFALSRADEPRTWDFRGTPADRKALAEYRLDKPRVERFVAALRMLDSAAKSDAALKKEVATFAPGNVTDKTIAEQITSFPKSFPRIAGAIEKKKYPARDLIMTSMSVATAQLAFFGGETPPDQLPDWIPAENVRALKEHAAILKPILAR